MRRTRGAVRRSLAAAVVVMASAAVLGACGGGSEPGADGELEPAEWVAAELTSVPDGYSIGLADQGSGFGRVIGYRRPGGGDDAFTVPIRVTARVPMGSGVEDLLATEVAPGAADPEGAAEGLVGGHRALLRPVPDGFDGTGWEVVWEPAPGLQLTVADTRRAVADGFDATRESALALAEVVGGLDRSGWDDVLAEHGGMASSPGPPPGAVEREVADGVLDARQWTLSVLGPADEDEGVGYCFRLSYAGEDTGDGCSVERVVLAGKGFVLGWIGGGRDPGELVAGPGSSFDPIEPQVHAYGRDDEQHVSIAVLPDGACGVTRIPRAGMVPTPLDLMPGDPGAQECARG